jgi:hypothetical protein
MDYCDVRSVLLTKLGGKITFLWRYENVMAGNKGWYEKNHNPWKIERQRNSCQNENAAKIERIP